MYFLMSHGSVVSCVFAGGLTREDSQCLEGKVPSQLFGGRAVKHVYPSFMAGNVVADCTCVWQTVV